MRPSGYIALDGPDGCGKTTQARRLAHALGAAGDEVVHLREPGSTPFGERLRELLLVDDVADLEPLSEALTFSAARREMLVNEVAPALDRGASVVVERCFLSTIVYQCRAPLLRAADESLVRAITAAVLGVHRPDLVVVLDLPASVARSRVGSTRDRIESRSADYHERVADAFRELAAPEPWLVELLGAGAIVRVDATADAEEVHREVLGAVARRRSR